MKKPTIKFKRRVLAKKVVENGGNIGEAMRDMNYSDTYANNPQKITSSKSWQQLMEKYLPEKKIIKIHKDQLDDKRPVICDKKITEYPDNDARLKAVDMLAKVLAMKINVKIDKYSDPEMVKLFKHQKILMDVWKINEEKHWRKSLALYRNDKSLDPDYCNPFYSNHVFTEADAKRVKIRKRDRLWLWLFPTFVQASGGCRFYFKCVNGAYYLMKTEHL